ncbi:MAG: HipA N-terminal domain-containing protein, partial [Propionibacteriaceae bacterium]|nr:HipA N-terminal domain-containing protein [Propionibacteriaceae bacterium]
MSDELAVWLGGAMAGRLTRDGQGVQFAYDDGYRSSRRVAPLSLSMPLASRVYVSAVVEPWLDNLLPDSDAVRARWAAASEIGVEPDWMVAEARRQADGLMTALEAVVVGEPDLD